MPALTSEEHEALIDAARANGHAELGQKPKRSRFAALGTIRLPLSDDDWVEIKRELTWGSLRRVADLSLERRRGDEGEIALVFRLDLQNLARLQIWLTDWSLSDERGVKVPLSRLSIEALDTDTGEEILKAITAYEEALAEAKKVMANPSVAVEPS